MKRVSISILFLIMCIMFSGCGKKEGGQAGKGWVIDDFNFYKEDGSEADFPTDESISLSEHLEETGEYLETHRKVKIGDRATTALEKYILDGFYYSIGDYKYINPSTDEANLLDEEFHDKYLTLKDALEGLSELSSRNMSVFASMQFYDKDGELKPYKLTDNGNVESYNAKYDTYKVIFMIEKEKISDVIFSKEPADKIASNIKVVDSIPVGPLHNDKVKFGMSKENIEKEYGVLRDNADYWVQDEKTYLGDEEATVSYYFYKDVGLTSVRYNINYNEKSLKNVKDILENEYGKPISYDLYEDGSGLMYWKMEDKEKSFFIDCHVGTLELAGSEEQIIIFIGVNKK